MNLLNNFANFLNSNAGIATWCGVILVLALFNYKRFREEMQKIIVELNGFIALVEKTEDLPTYHRIKSASQNTDTKERKPSFGNELIPGRGVVGLDAAFSKSSLISHGWLEFKETLILPEVTEGWLTAGEVSPGNDSYPIIENTQVASNFFSRSSILNPKLNIRYYSALPNILTGLGILGTFAGLVAGIYLAAPSLGSDSLEDARDALDMLLEGAALAFMTSIVGLLASIVFSWKEKHWIHVFDDVCHKWVRALDTRVMWMPAEMIAERELKELQKQTKALDSFSNDLAVSLGGVLDQRVTAPMNEVMNRVVEAVDALRESQKATSDDVLERLASQFSETFRDAAGEEMKAFGETVKAMSSSLESNIEAMAKGNQEMQTASQSMIQELMNTFEQGSKQLQQDVSLAIDSMVSGVKETVESMLNMIKTSTEQTVSVLDQLFEQFKGSITQLDEVIKEVSSITETTANALSLVDSLVLKLDEAHGELAKTAESISAAINEFDSLSAGVNQAAKLMEQCHTKMSESIENLLEIQQDVRQGWEDYIGRFQNVDQSLEKVFVQIDEGLANFAKQTSDYVRNLDENSGKIVRDFSGAVSELSETLESIEDFSNAVNKLSDKLEIVEK